ncbi:hypothetical protein LINGRAPRIM_LOCUS1199 [Linum grandiflorum]
MPWDYRLEEPVGKIARNYFPGLIEVDKKSLDRSRWTRDVKIFVNVTVADPLIPYFYLKTKKAPEQRVKFRYEGLLEVCIFCGRIGHEIGDCKERKLMMLQGHDGEPTGEYRNLKFKPSDGPMSDDDSEEIQYKPDWERENQGGERMESSDRSFSTPSLNSPAGLTGFTPQSMRSEANSSYRSREPLLEGPTTITPKFHHFFPDIPSRVNPASPIRRVNLTALFDSEGHHSETLNQERSNRRPGKAIMTADNQNEATSANRSDLKALQALWASCEPMSPFRGSSPEIPPGFEHSTPIRPVPRRASIPSPDAQDARAILLAQSRSDHLPRANNPDSPALRAMPTLPPSFSLGPFPSHLQQTQPKGASTQHPPTLSDRDKETGSMKHKKRRLDQSGSPPTKLIGNLSISPSIRNRTKKKWTLNPKAAKWSKRTTKAVRSAGYNERNSVVAPTAAVAIRKPPRSE